MGLNNTAKNYMLTQLTGVAIYMSLHTADPGESGTSEVSGGSYARKSVTWGTPSGGSVSASNQPVFDVPASTTVSYVGLWSAASGGTFYGSANVDDETFTNAGTYTVTSAQISIT